MLSASFADDKIAWYENDGSPSDLGIDYGTAYPISRKFLFGVNLGL